MTNELKTLRCKRCSEDFFPSYWEVLGIKVLKGDGYCPDCSKVVYEEELAKEEAVRLAEIANARKTRRENCGIPLKFMNQDFSTFEKGWQDKAYQKCCDYAENFPIDKRPYGYQSLYLWSSQSWGTGKTHLSCAIIHRILDRWKGENDKGCPRIMFLSESDLFRRIQATYSFSREEQQMRESEDDIVKSIIYADVVVLDDIGKEPRSDMKFVRRTLFSIIDGRYKSNLPIVLSSNCAPSGLKGYIGDATFDRIWELTKGKGIRMDGKSYRRKEES